MYYMNHLISVFRRILNYIKNYLKSFLKNKNWIEKENDPPMTLSFQTTNICNANCIFCGYQFDKGSKGFLNNDIFKRALKEYIDIGGKNVALAPMTGEPFLDPCIIEKIKLIKKESKIKSCYLFTNGISLDNVNINDLLLSGIDTIHISTSGFDKNMYQRLYRSDKYDITLENIHELLKKNKQLGKPVEIKLDIRCDEPVRKVLNKKDFKEKISSYLDKKDISFLLYYDNWGGLIKKEELSGNMKIGRPKKGKGPCIRTFSAMITWDGKVRACGCRSLFKQKDELIIGDLNKDSFGEIWYNTKIKKLRRSFEKGDIPEVCQNCTMYTPV